MTEHIENELRRRLKHILKSHSLSQVARKTGIPVSSIHRYCSNRRIPANACVRLVKDLDVHAGWLLTGDGRPFATDLLADSEGLAKELLESALDIKRATSTTIGTLQGMTTSRNSVLDELSRALESHRNAHKTLNRKSAPVLRELIGKARQCLATGAPRQESELALRRAEAVARFCTDEDLALELLDQQAHFAFTYGLREQALHLVEKLVARTVVAGRNADPHFGERVINYCVVLAHALQIRQALRMGRVGIALLGNEAGTQRSLNMLHLANAQFKLELGNLTSGLREVGTYFPRLSRDDQRINAGSSLKPQLLAGLMTVEDALRIHCSPGTKPSPSVTQQLLLMSIHVQSPHCIAKLLSTTATKETRKGAHQSLISLHASFVLSALEKPHKCDVKEFEAHAQIAALDTERGFPDDVSRFVIDVARAQLLLLQKKKREARKAVSDAETWKHKIDPRRSPPLLYRSIHARNTVLALKKSARTPEEKKRLRKATSFIEALFKRGYGGLQNVDAGAAT